MSIGEMLIAGILPGIVYAVIMALAIGLFCYLKPSYAPRASGVNTSWKARWKSVKTLWAVVFLFVLVLGSIYFGWATPDEAAGVGVFGTFLIVVYRKKFKWRDVMMATLDAGKTSAMIFLILGSASIFSGFVLLTGVFSAISDWVIAQDLPLWGIFVALNILWLLWISAWTAFRYMILTLPISIPIMQAHNINLVWFGIVMTMNLLIGTITPPFAFELFRAESSIGRSSGNERHFFRCCAFHPVDDVYSWIFLYVSRTQPMVAKIDEGRIDETHVERLARISVSQGGKRYDGKDNHEI